MTANYIARSGCSFAFPRITVTATDFAGDVTTLVGSVAVLEIGSVYGAAPKLTIRSDDTPVAPAEFTWDDGASESTLDAKLSPDQVDTLGPGQWVGVLKIEGPGEGDVQHRVREMTLPLTVERWPVPEE